MALRAKLAELVKESAADEEEVNKQVLLSLRDLVNDQKELDQLDFEQCGDRRVRPEDEIVIEGGIWKEDGHEGNLFNRITAIVKRKRQIDKERKWEERKKARNKRIRICNQNEEGTRIGIRKSQMKNMFQELTMLTDSDEALRKQLEKDLSQQNKRKGEGRI